MDNNLDKIENKLPVEQVRAHLEKESDESLKKFIEGQEGSDISTILGWTREDMVEVAKEILAEKSEKLAA